MLQEVLLVCIIGVKCQSFSRESTFVLRGKKFEVSSGCLIFKKTVKPLLKCRSFGSRYLHPPGRRISRFCRDIGGIFPEDELDPYLTALDGTTGPWPRQPKRSGADDGWRRDTRRR